MSLAYTVQKGVSDLTFIIGTGMKYGGGFALFAMAVVGTMAIDMVLIAIAQKNHNQFLTGFVLGSMFSNGGFTNPLALFVCSPITSGIAVVLSFAFGVPGVGIGLLIGWGSAAALLGLGFGLIALADAIQPEPELDVGYVTGMSI